MTSEGLKSEDKVRKKLEVSLGKKLVKKKLVIGCDSAGNRKEKEFDIVSEDGEIVGEIKDYKFSNSTTGTAGYSNVRKYRLIAECFFLERVSARRKILALTNRELAEQFRKDMDGLKSDVEIMHVPIR
ncbi:MAG: hypothetical protein M0042_11240 [Nitrospiraceae bacterium]|nr:hypothetical protein [Nitrospiraceae bacterium]